MKPEGRIVEVESFTTPGVRYEVDLSKKTCSCPAFKKRPTVACKHLRSFEGLFQQSSEPDPNEALSAFIKAVRLRRLEDAVTWLLYLWRIPQYQARVQRRILIAAAEDNLSLGVMERAAEWYGSIDRLSLDYAAREVCRICTTPNWWAQPGGHAYIFNWLKAEKEGVPTAYGSGQLELLGKQVDERHALGALKTFGTLYASGRLIPEQLATALGELASRSGSVQALKLAELYRANLRSLGMDSNVSGQALYAILFGDFGKQIVPSVEIEVSTLIDEGRQRLAANPRIPDWALDGIHTGRYRDRRFAGTLRMMAGCCRAFLHYERLDPADRWLPEFFGEADG